MELANTINSLSLALIQEEQAMKAKIIMIGSQFDQQIFNDKKVIRRPRSKINSLMKFGKAAPAESKIDDDIEYRVEN